VGEYVVLVWSTYEDRSTTRHGIEEMVSIRGIGSDTSTNLGDEVYTP